EDAFAPEAELLVETDRGLVVRPDLERELVDAALVRPVDAALHQRGADAAPAPFLGNRHPDLGRPIYAAARVELPDEAIILVDRREVHAIVDEDDRDRKSTRLNSSHSQISYAVFCLKKKKKN